MPNLQPSGIRPFKLGLIGYPLGHSKSPQLHAEFLRKCGLKGKYKLYPIPPDDVDALKALLNRVRKGEIHGLNVTIPHKQNIIPLLDELSDTAQAIGAANTIVFREGKLIGENTDTPGFWKDLQKLRPDGFPKHVRSHALILGSGGAARAVTYALLNAGWQITLATRKADIPQAQSLIKNFTSYNPNFTNQLSNTELKAPTLSPLLSTLSLIVNTTPVGMKSHLQGSPYPKKLPFPSNAVLYDLIYNPSKTKLMQDAEEAGIPVRGGVGMLESQAELSFEIWTGCQTGDKK